MSLMLRMGVSPILLRKVTDSKAFSTIRLFFPKAPMRYHLIFCILSFCLSCHCPSLLASDHDSAHRRVVRKVVPVPDMMPSQATKDMIVRISLPKIPSTGNVYNERGLEGIDVSHYQGRIDWKRVAKEGGARYAYIKATEGEQLVDEFYAYNISEARKAGIAVGAYHFYRPQRGVKANFDNMTSVVKRHDIDLLPIIDVESTGGMERQRFLDDLREFVRCVEKHYGCPPMLYTGQSFYNKHFQGFLTDYCWMIARYQDAPPILLDGNTPCMWQYTQEGRVAGVKGCVDRSKLMSDNFRHLYIEKHKYKGGRR